MQLQYPLTRLLRQPTPTCGRAAFRKKAVTFLRDCVHIDPEFLQLATTRNCFRVEQGSQVGGLDHTGTDSFQVFSYLVVLPQHRLRTKHTDAESPDFLIKNLVFPGVLENQLGQQRNASLVAPPLGLHRPFDNPAYVGITKDVPRGAEQMRGVCFNQRCVFLSEPGLQPSAVFTAQHVGRFSRHPDCAFMKPDTALLHGTRWAGNLHAVAFTNQLKTTVAEDTFGRTRVHQARFCFN